MLSFKVKYAAQVLFELGRAGKSGKRLTVGELKNRCGFDGRGLTSVLSRLRHHQWIDQTNNRHFVKVDLTRITLYDLVMTMDEGLNMGCNVAVDGWPWKNKNKCAVAMELDYNLEEEMKTRLQSILFSELFPCEETNENNTYTHDIPGEPKQSTNTNTAA